MRNPYFHQTDEACKQLPYINRVISQIASEDTYDLRILGGEVDVAMRPFTFNSFDLYKRIETSSNFVIKLIPGVRGNETAYAFNLNHADPLRRELYNDLRFRQAMSLGVNRDALNQLVYSGRATPRHVSVKPNTSYYDPDWAENHPFARYDPDEANRILDELDLTRGVDGVRRDAAGSTINITIEHSSSIHRSIVLEHELVKEFWEALGFTVQVKEVADNIWGERSWRFGSDVISYPVQGNELHALHSRHMPRFEPHAPGWLLLARVERASKVGLARYR